MPFTIKGAAKSQEQMMRSILDYKTEMCTMIDNINNVEVFRYIAPNMDVDGSLGVPAVVGVVGAPLLSAESPPLQVPEKSPDRVRP